MAIIKGRITSYFWNNLYAGNNFNAYKVKKMRREYFILFRKLIKIGLTIFKAT